MLWGKVVFLENVQGESGAGGGEGGREMWKMSEDALGKAADAETVLGQSECSQVYNPEEIDGDSNNFCDTSRASIKQFVEVRRETLLEEILQQ